MAMQTVHRVEALGSAGAEAGVGDRPVPSIAPPSSQNRFHSARPLPAARSAEVPARDPAFPGPAPSLAAQPFLS